MSNKNDRWSALSMSDRADLIKLYVSSGITSLDDIKKDYNSFGGGGRILDGTETEQTLSGVSINTYVPLESREDYLNKQRQNAIDASLEKSYSRTNPDVPKRLKYANETSWREILEAKINYNKYLIRSYIPEDLIHESNVLEKQRLINENALLTKELSEGYKEEYIDGASCIYTATGNYGDAHKCSWNVWFRENPEKYGFTEINLKDVKPGDIIQDFTNVEGIPNHALTFIGYDDSGKARYNYSSGGNDSKAIKKQAYYPYELDYGQFTHFTKDNAEDLQSAIAAYRFVGNEEENLKWNNDYNQYRKEYSSKVLEELKDVPKLPTDKARILDGTEDEQTTTGLPVGAGLATYNHPKYNHTEEAEMYSYLRSRGVPHVQASAIMGNIAVESMLNPEITQIRGGGGYGLIQATDRSRKKAFINHDGQPYEFGSNITPETQRQLDYIIDKGLNTQTRGEWRGNHNIGRASVARRKFLEATDVNKASKIFTENYLRPGKPHTKRRKSMSNYFNDNYGITERALEEFENSFLFQNN